MNHNLLHRKESLVLRTIEIIDELGIQGLSTREIAKRENISEGTIFRHYKTKNDLILAALDYYSQFDEDIIESIKIKKLTSKKAIMYYINAFAEYYENYPAITAITQAYDVLESYPELSKKVKSIFSFRSQFIKELIEKAQKEKNEFSSIDAEMLMDMVLGTFREVCLKWRFSNYEFSLKKYVTSAIKALLDSFV